VNGTVEVQHPKPNFLNKATTGFGQLDTLTVSFEQNDTKQPLKILDLL